VISNRSVALLCLAQVLGLANYSAVPAILPVFFDAWGLDNAEAGWLAGVYLGGYTAAVLPLVALTDRIPARALYLWSMVLTAVACLGFALFADGLWTGAALRALAGAGLAGTYMPGLKALSDRVEGARRSRVVAWYTTAFSVGAGLSFVIAGAAAERFGWRGAFVLCGILALVALVLAWIGLPRETARPPRQAGPLLQLGPVFRNRPAMAYVLAYCAVVWGVAGLRNWIVVFLGFAAATQPDGAWIAGGLLIAALANIVGVPAGLLGNELAIRLGLKPVAIAIFLAGAAGGAVFGFAASLPFAAVAGLAVLYAFVAQGNISSATAGTIQAADPARMGTTMAVHSFIGFSGGFAAPFVFGLVLDLAGGNAAPLAWVLAFASCGLACLLGALAVAVLDRPSPAVRA
jgi:MFS family permease